MLSGSKGKFYKRMILGDEGGGGGVTEVLKSDKILTKDA